MIPDDCLSVADRLRIAVKCVGGNAEASRRARIPLSSFYNYLRGRELRIGDLVALADACQVNIPWLAAGRGPMAEGEYTPPPAKQALASDPDPSPQPQTDQDRHQLGGLIQRLTNDDVSAVSDLALYCLVGGCTFAELGHLVEMSPVFFSHRRGDASDPQPKAQGEDA